MGLFVLLIIILAFIAGRLRNEPALTLSGAVFSAVWCYCLVMTGLLALIHRGRAADLSVRFSPNQIAAGGTVEPVFSAAGKSGGGRKKFLRLPAILVRYFLHLNTRDGRKLLHIFDPDFPVPSLRVPLRGAWYGAYDELSIFDGLGFFRFSFRIPQGGGPRLLSCPRAAEEAPSLPVRSGGEERRPDAHYLRSDNLIDHRPYIPGDDPRRINWKLYGHGGDLFIREGEPEPPPHSRLLILIDTGADTALYTGTEAGDAVDLLCENALAAALAYRGRGMDVRIGSTTGPGGILTGGAAGAAGPAGTSETGSPPDAAELDAALAYPAAFPLPEPSAAAPVDFPPLAGDGPRSGGKDRGLLILALPRTGAGGALDRFLNNRDPAAGGMTARQIDLLFLYGDTGRRAPAREQAAKTCAGLYGQRSGVHAAALPCRGSTRGTP
ncbi:MAG: DUF58 domain-containing protein [Treponema sp.]|jgi:hypothetical protein|nr:DUF58 domain-containing protein [Treponema sp.]